MGEPWPNRCMHYFDMLADVPHMLGDTTIQQLLADSLVDYQRVGQRGTAPPSRRRSAVGRREEAHLAPGQPGARLRFGDAHPRRTVSLRPRRRGPRLVARPGTGKTLAQHREPASRLSTARTARSSAVALAGRSGRGRRPSEGRAAAGLMLLFVRIETMTSRTRSGATEVGTPAAAR